MASLIGDLKERGLLDATLVIWMGEFGRTPGNGSNHFARAWSTVLAGGGLKTGQVIGRTSAKGDTVEERPIPVIDFMATVCQALGIDPNKRIREGGSGRPHRIVDQGAKPVTELFA
jgi:arylsulfatase A-like enzyme